MKVHIVWNRDNETKVVDLPMDERELLKVQGSVLDRDTIGYITGVEVKYYDDNGKEIENIFLLNRQLKN
ncbi:hypothetical protein H8S20_10045 [Clostridium sp. NSJ-6]|uniref:DUF2283 domain-containing protein n=1 Tax=Clostridium hominis TaxID=2763036 RepID=A0ABR7DCW5_9CLOT|nr:hypothetical protein [Clostridium hominis]MBC5629235.1 hypothetical protein [Clostridium hominis]